MSNKNTANLKAIKFELDDNSRIAIESLTDEQKVRLIPEGALGEGLEILTQEQCESVNGGRYLACNTVFK
jgi:hypothetical protein